MNARDQHAARKAVHPAATLTIILVCYFMILLDNSVIFTALPSLKAGLDLSAGQLSWVQDAYTLVFGGLLLLGARAGDLLGRRRVFISGLAVFSVASVLVGVSPVGWWAIAARALQGVGAAIVAPSSLSLLTASFPEGKARSRAVAWYGATAGIGASLGLLIGGALTQWISWRAGFFVNFPIGAAMIVLAPRYLPETPRSSGRFDLAGAVTATTFAPLTSAGIVGATARDAGAASGLVNTFHQVGMAFGLGVLVAVAAHARAGGVNTAARLAAQVSAALTAGSILLALSLIAALALIVPAAATRRHNLAAAHEDGPGLPVSEESPACALTGNK